VEAPLIFILSRLVLGDHVLWFSKQWSRRVSLSGGCFGGKNVFFEEALTDELF